MATKPNDTLQPSNVQGDQVRSIPDSSSSPSGIVKQVNFVSRPNAIVAEGGAKVIFVCG